MHYLELDESNRVGGIFPLREEIAGTAFYNGIIFVVPTSLGRADLFVLLDGLRGKGGNDVLTNLLNGMADRFCVVPPGCCVTLFHSADRACRVLNELATGQGCSF